MSTQRIAIVTDSSAYIPEEARKGLNISVIPLWLLWDGETYQDGINIQPAAFYQRLKESKTLPTSSQPSAQEFVDFYRKVAQEADAIVSVLVSSKISGTIASAQAAVAELPYLNIRIVGSLSSAMGLGLAVLSAARAAANGKSVDEVVAAAEQTRSRVNMLFVVDTLDYLFELFGLTAEQVLAKKRAGYSPRDELRDTELANAIDLIARGAFSRGDRSVFAPLVEDLLERDPFLVLADFRAYADAQQRVAAAWRTYDVAALVDPQRRAHDVFLLGPLDPRVRDEDLERALTGRSSDQVKARTSNPGQSRPAAASRASGSRRHP